MGQLQANGNHAVTYQVLSKAGGRHIGVTTSVSHPHEPVQKMGQKVVGEKAGGVSEDEAEVWRNNN